MEFALSVPARLSLSIFDLRGRRMRELVKTEVRPAGSYSETWDGTDDDGRRVEAGLYFARLSMADSRSEWRIVIAR